MNDLLINIGVGLGLMVCELVLIRILINRITTKRERKLWIPFRSMFYRAVYHYHDELIRIWEFWSDTQRMHLRAVKSRGHLIRKDIEILNDLYRTIAERRESAQSSFHKAIQTSTASLTPDTGPYCHEPMYFDDILGLHSGECMRILKTFDFDQLENKPYTEAVLKTLWAKQLSMELLMLRFNQYPETLKARIASSEDLYFYRGDFLPREDYEHALRSEARIEDYKIKSKEIPRTMPIYGFFDKEFTI